MREYAVREWHRKKAEEKGMRILPTVMPPLVFTYRLDLVWQAALDVEVSGRYPTPQEVANRDQSWQRDINTMLEWLDFIRGQMGSG